MLLVLLALACAGCTTPAALRGAGAAPAPDPRSAACQAWYTQLDAAIDQAGVRDASATRVPGHAYLRVDRFHASLRDRLPQAADAPSAAALRSALMVRLLALDLQARQYEIANLPAALRASLSGAPGGGTEPDVLLQHAQACGKRLAAEALAQRSPSHALLQSLAVPPDYVTAYRALGLYPLTRIPFFLGVTQLENEIRATFGQARDPDPAESRQLLQPPWRPAPHLVTPARLRAMLQPAQDDPLAIPQPDAAQQEILFAHFAPAFDLAIRSGDDRPGALVWRAGAGAGNGHTPAVDTGQPVVYRQLAWTRHGQDNLLQLVYTIWFGARTATRWPIDLLAGRLDGLVWRVTLSPQGVPVMFDSIHPCGCYHQFFPPAWVRPRPAPDPRAEWAFSPAPAPVLAPGQQLVLRVAPATHYIDALDAATPQPTASRYAWRDYDMLRALPRPDAGRRSVFDADGFIPGTDRAEAWLFWPMGIARAGAMRQWGRHATAFVGRRHFDDARLIEQRFVLTPPPADD